MLRPILRASHLIIPKTKLTQNKEKMHKGMTNKMGWIASDEVNTLEDSRAERRDRLDTLVNPAI